MDRFIGLLLAIIFTSKGKIVNLFFKVFFFFYLEGELLTYL